LGARMEFHQVKYFLTVCETLNFTAAAEICNVTPPSLTKGIKKLETELGGELFRRERSRTHQTELGRLMHPILSKCFEGARQAMEVAQAFSSGEQARIRIGICESVEIDRITDALCELVNDTPAIELSIRRDQNNALFASMENGEVDFAIGPEPSRKWDRLNSWHLFEEPFAAFAGAESEHAGLQSFPLAGIAGQTLLSEPFCPYNEALHFHLEEQNIEPRAVHTTTSRSDTFSFLRRNLGIAIMPFQTTTSPDIRAIPIPDLDLTCTVSIHTVAGRQYSPAGAAFARIIKGLGCVQHH